MLRMKVFHTNASAILITFMIINDVTELKLQFHISRLKHYIAARLKKPKGLNKQKMYVSYMLFINTRRVHPVGQ